MASLNFQRAFTFALQDFYRNKGMAVAAIFVISVTILLVTGLFFLQGMSQFLITSIQSKIDITTYFKEDTQEQDILAVRDEIKNISPEIQSVEYVSREKALDDFLEAHKDNPTFADALGELGENPFLASLNITTGGETAHYEQISNVLQSGQYANLIEKVDFAQKKETIEKIFSISAKISWFGAILGLVLIIVAVLVVFNTIKLAIENSREEINTMRIVGASYSFIRAPFIIQGAMFGAIAFIICLAITVVVTSFLSLGVSVIMPGFSLFGFFLQWIWLVVLLQIGFGIGLGILSSYIVVRRYLAHT